MRGECQENTEGNHGTKEICSASRGNDDKSFLDAPYLMCFFGKLLVANDFGIVADDGDLDQFHLVVDPERPFSIL